MTTSTMRLVQIFATMTSLVLTHFVSADDYIRLIPSNPMPSLNAPYVTKISTGMTRTIDLISALGPKFNDLAVHHLLEKRLDEEVRRGFQEADETGQRGVLLRTQILTSQTAAGPYYQLRGDGANLVGVGPNADAVCFSQKCFQPGLDVVIPPGASLAEGSGYVWIERQPDGKYVQSMYRLNLLETRASQVYLNLAMRATFRQAIKGEAFTGYIERLQAKAATNERKKELADIEAKRKEVTDRIKTIEAAYAAEMRRQRDLADAAATMNALKGILSTASMLNSVYNAIGSSIGNPTDFSSPQAVVDKLQSMAKDSGGKAEKILVQQKTYYDEQGQIEQQVLQFGMELNMPVPKPGSVLLPLP